jgi:hypothetical protein
VVPSVSEGRDRHRPAQARGASLQSRGWAIQYAETYRSIRDVSGILGSPAFAGDDGQGLRLARDIRDHAASPRAGTASPAARRARIFLSGSRTSMSVAGAHDKMAPLSQRQMRGNPQRGLGCIQYRCNPCEIRSISVFAAPNELTNESEHLTKFKCFCELIGRSICNCIRKRGAKLWVGRPQRRASNGREY